MTHPRQLIRHHVRGLLLNKTLAQSRVFAHRIHAFFERELPCIMITTPHETANQFLEAPRELKRELTLALQAIVQMVDGVEEHLDVLAQQIESLMHADPFLGGCASDSLLSETEMEILTEGRLPLGFINLQYKIWYYTYVPTQQELTDLERIEAIQLIKCE